LGLAFLAPVPNWPTIYPKHLQALVDVTPHSTWLPAKAICSKKQRFPERSPLLLS
jgi:hypothetical protein